MEPDERAEIDPFQFENRGGRRDVIERDDPEQAETSDAGEDEMGFRESADNDIAPDAEAPGDRKRPRSRRRRGGRGRKSGERQEAGSAEPRRPAARRHDPEMLETPGADDFDDLTDDEDEDASTDDDFDSDDSVDDELDENGDGETSDETRPTRSRTAGHRSIPSWDEAIGMIVANNMQGRTHRRPSTGPGGQGGSGQRGRPRGGRRRRKPS